VQLPPSTRQGGEDAPRGTSCSQNLTLGRLFGPRFFESLQEQVPHYEMKGAEGVPFERRYFDTGYFTVFSGPRRSSRSGCRVSPLAMSNWLEITVKECGKRKRIIPPLPNRLDQQKLRCLKKFHPNRQNRDLHPSFK